MKMFSSIALVVLSCGLPAFSPSHPTEFSRTHAKTIERGTFHLFIWRLPVGKEIYTIESTGESTVLRSNFDYTYTQKKVSLTTMLRMRQDLQPENFETKGNSFLGDAIDTSVEIKGRQAIVREGGETSKLVVPDQFFAMRTPFPVAVEMMAVRYWMSHQVKNQFTIFPSKRQVMIDYAGRDTINVGNDRVQFDCYSMKGLTWGRIWLWFDSAKRLIALVSPNADTSSQLQAVREGYESALPDFLSKAAEHGMIQLRQMTTPVKPNNRGVVAIVGGVLVDGTGKDALKNSVVVIHRGKISAVGSREQVKIPKGATLLDAHGKTILPGLWDMHAHLRQVEWGPTYLAAGVTTVRDVGNDLEFVTAMRKAIQSGRGLGPRLLLAGFIDGTDPTSVAGYQADTPEEAQTLVRMYKWANFDQIKVWNNVKPEILKVIATEAHRQGLTVTGHIPKGMNASQAVEAGQDQINHAAFIVQSLPNGDINSEETRKAFQFFKERGTVVDPTLAVVELLTHSTATPIKTFEPAIVNAPFDVAAVLAKLGVPPEHATGARSFFDLALDVVRSLHSMGVPIVAGTDQVVPGHSLHRELELYVKAGLTPMEAIQAATIVPARVMKMDREVGTIERGKRADLVITNGSPLDNISNIRNVRYVVTNGMIYDSSQLWQVAGFKP